MKHNTVPSLQHLLKYCFLEVKIFGLIPSSFIHLSSEYEGFFFFLLTDFYKANVSLLRLFIDILTHLKLEIGLLIFLLCRNQCLKEQGLANGTGPFNTIY